MSDLGMSTDYGHPEKNKLENFQVLQAEAKFPNNLKITKIKGQVALLKCYISTDHYT